MSYSRYDVPNESGAVVSGLTLNYDSMYVNEGGTAEATTLNSGGSMQLNGGIANNTIVNSYGAMCVYTNGVANSTTVNSAGYMTVYYGSANDTVLNGGGSMYFESATGSGVTVNSGADLSFYGSNNVTGIVENGGCVYVGGNGTVTFTPNTFADLDITTSCEVTVHSGTTALRTSMNASASIVVYRGGSAVGTLMNGYWGRMYVLDSGTALDTVVNGSGSVWISSGGAASNTTVNSGGQLVIDHGAGANGVTLASRGRLVVYSSATVTGIDAEDGAVLYVYLTPGTVLSGTSGGKDISVSDGKADGLTVESGGYLYVSNGTTATNTTVKTGGSMYIRGTATGIIEDGGYVSAASPVTFTPHEFKGAVLEGGASSATAHAGTTATDITVNGSAVLFVYDGGVVNGATLSGCSKSDEGFTRTAYIVLSAGATASGVITANELGRVRVEAGATVADGATLVENGGGFELPDGVEPTFQANAFGNRELMGYVTVHSGTTATDVSVVSSNGAFHLYKGGSAYNIALGSSYYDNCSGFIHSGAVASGLSGRAWTVEGGAVVYDLNGGGSIAGTVSGANVTGPVTILNGGRMVSAIAPYIDGMGYGIFVQNGGTLEKSVFNGGYGYVSAGGTVTDLTVTTGVLYVSAGATVTGLNFSSGSLNVFGGSVTGLVLAGEQAYLYLRVDPTTDAFVSGKMADGTDILLKDGRFEHFSANSIGLGIVNGGVADDIAFVQGGVHVSAGGTATNLDVSSGGSVFVSAGGTLSGATFHGVKDKYGNYYSSAGALLGIEGGEATGIKLEGGRVSMTSGTLQDVDVNGGYMWLYGGTAKDAVVSSGGSVVAGYTCSLENVKLANLGYMSLGEGAKATGTVLSAVQVVSTYGDRSWTEDHGGYLNVSYGGVASDTTVGSGCQFWVYYGGSASGVTVNGGGYMRLDGYGRDYYGYYPLSWGIADDVTVQSGGSVHIGGGASATNLKMEDGAKATISLVSSAGLEGTLVQGTYAGSAFEVADGHMTDFGALEKGFVIAVFSGGVLSAVKETRIVSGASLEIESGGVVLGADRFTVEQGGRLYLGGGEYSGKIKENGGYVGVYNSGYGDGTPIEFEANTFTGLTLSGCQSATVHSGTVASKTKLLVDYTDPHTSGYYDAYMAVYNGGLAYDTDVAGGYLRVYSGGSVSRTVVHSRGCLYLESAGAFAGDVTLEDAAEMSVWNIGASASGVTMKGDSVGMTLGSSATVSSTVVSGGSLLLYYGASAFQTDLKGGSMTVGSEALASSASVGDGAGMTVSSGGTAVDVTVAKGGKLLVEGSGFVSGLTSVGGEVTVGYSATLTGETQVADGAKVVVSGYRAFLDGQATVFGGGTVSVESGGTIAAAITVKNGAEITVGTDGWLTGQLTVETGATVAMAEGSVFSFDISGISEPSDKPLLNDYSALSGTPEIAITVSADGQPHGTYILADNAAGFNKTVTVYYDYSESRYKWGELSLDSGPVQFGEDFYTLTLSEENQLVLTVGDYIADNGPDKGWNNVDKLWDKKAKKPVDGGIYDSDATPLYAGTPILLDKPLTVNQSFDEHDGKTITYSNFVGKITGKGFDPDTDDSDCGKFELTTGARLSFNVTVRAAGNFVIYQITETPDKKEPLNPAKMKYSLKKVQTTSISVKKNTTYSAVSTKAVYLEAGTYFFSMEAKIDKKKDTEGFYNVELNYSDDPKKPGTKFYSAGDDGWNNYLYDSKTKTLNPYSGSFRTLSPGTGTYNVQLDSSSYYYDSKTGRSWRNFVGFGDKTDFARLNPASPVKLNFTVSATDASTFTVWSLTAKGKDQKTGNTLYTMKALKTIKLKKGDDGLYSAPENELLLDRLSSSEDSNVGYYVSMQSTSSNKDAEAYYDASVVSYAFGYADNGDNQYLYDKKADPAHYNPSLYSNRIVAGAGAGKLRLETGGSLGVSRLAGEEYETYDNFVGFGDEWDYAEIELTSAGTCTFTFDAYCEGTVANASPALKFAVYSLTRVVKGETVTWKQKTLASQTIEVKDKYVSGEPLKKALAITEATSDDVRYFVSMQSAGAAKGAEVFYNVSLGLTPPAEASALAMPDYSGFGQEDVLAEAAPVSPMRYDGEYGGIAGLLA